LQTAIALAQASAVPTQLSQLAVGITEEDLAVIIDRSLSTPDMGNMPGEIEFGAIRSAIERVELLSLPEPKH